MKNYSVVYLTDAEAELVSIWEAAANRAEISQAANTADKILGDVPRDRSVYLGESLWRLEVTPLKFYFVLREADRLVEITNVIEAR